MQESIACIDINGIQLNYKLQKYDGWDAWCSDDIGVSGVLYSEIIEFNGNPVLFQYMIVPSSENNCSSLVLRANQIADDGTEEAMVQILDPEAFGNNFRDDYRYTMYQRNNLLIFEGHCGIFANADGETYWVEAYEFDGTTFECILNESASGSTIGEEFEWKDRFYDIAARFDAVGLNASAQSMRENYNGVKISPSENLDKIFTIVGRNSYFDDYNWDVPNFKITLKYMLGYESEYLIEDSNTRYLTNADLAGMNSEELRYARNEIYARHGRKFKDEELQNYFNSKSWYTGYRDEIPETELSDIEKANRDLIASLE